MVDQKGFDLIEALAADLPRLDAAYVVLGTGESRYQDFWRRLADAYPDRIGVHIGFEEGLAHMIEGGADIFLMPSRFEPCGLNQMYSLRYGTVPVVRAVGGLADTVRDNAGDTAPKGNGRRLGSNGFVFEEYSPTALLSALSRAIHAFSKPRVWQKLQRIGMKEDFSWHRSAREYVKIYARVNKQAPYRAAPRR
jgi:starch synthase